MISLQICILVYFEFEKHCRKSKTRLNLSYITLHFIQLRTSSITVGRQVCDPGGNRLFPLGWVFIYFLLIQLVVYNLRATGLTTCLHVWNSHWNLVKPLHPAAKSFSKSTLLYWSDVTLSPKNILVVLGTSHILEKTRCLFAIKEFYFYIFRFYQKYFSLSIFLKGLKIDTLGVLKLDFIKTQTVNAETEQNNV